MVIAVAVGSWMLMQQRQRDMTEENKQRDSAADQLEDRVTALERRADVSDSKREEMLRVLRENSEDVKKILQKIAELATLISVSGRRDD